MTTEYAIRCTRTGRVSAARWPHWTSAVLAVLAALRAWPEGFEVVPVRAKDDEQKAA